jgi:TPR repeat protein
MSELSFNTRALRAARRLLLFASFFSFLVSFPAHADSLEKATELFVAKNYDEAFPIFLTLAKEGDPKAQGTLARMYGNGWGVQADDKEAYYWASRGVNKEDPTSQHVLGYIHWQGLAGFPKSADQAILWFEKAFKNGYSSSAHYLTEVYEHASHLSNHEEKAFYWAEQSASLGNAESMNKIARSFMWGLFGQKKDQRAALEWYEKSAAHGSADGYLYAGMVYMYGGSPIEDKLKAIKNLDTASTLGVDHATYFLARGYLFGDGAIEEDREKGYSLLKVLNQSDSKHLGYELESVIYGEGIDRPRNLQKAIHKGISGMKYESGMKSGIDRHAGSIAGEYIINNGLLLGIGLPTNIELNWLRFLHNALVDAQDMSEDDRAKLTSTARIFQRIEQSEKLTVDELIEHTLNFLESRRMELGPIEPADLVNEGWVQFLGTRGAVNEPLAQLLTEEGLRLAIRTKKKHVEDVARNNLGVFFIGAANKNIKNPRLAQVHLYDGRNSEWGPGNLLWNHYLGEISLSEDDLIELRARHLKEQGSRHRTETMPPFPKENTASLEQLTNFLISEYRDGDLDLATEIGFKFENGARSNSDYEKAIYWLKRGKDKDDRVERLQKVLAGNFVSDMPNFTGTINQLFEVDLVETRGGLLTNLSSAISASIPKSLKLDRSQKRLNLYALVIGNSAYKGNELKNSANDARSMARKLRQLGFQVTEALNLDRRKFRDTLVRFSEQAKDSDVTIFFYAGHGMQLGGVNYLLPTDTDFSLSEAVITYDGISLNDLKNRSLPGATRLIFLDACRNNPFDLLTRGGQGRGLAPINVGTGTLISFATRDGSVALDGVGGTNSPYTQALLKYIDSTEDVEIMLRSVGDEVVKLTRNMQQPWKYGALSGQKVIISTLAR